jgi:hypothetical protein
MNTSCDANLAAHSQSTSLWEKKTALVRPSLRNDDEYQSLRKVYNDVMDGPETGVLVRFTFRFFDLVGEQRKYGLKFSRYLTLSYSNVHHVSKYLRNAATILYRRSRLWT